MGQGQVQGGANLRGNNINGLNALNNQQGVDPKVQELVQLAQKILEQLQGGGKAGNSAAPQNAQNAGQGGEGEDFASMARKLLEELQRNPEAARAALQNPAVQQVLQVALSGGGGGGSIGGAKAA